MQRSTSLVRQALRVARSAGHQPVAVRAFASTPTRFATEAKIPHKGSRSKLLQTLESEIKEEAKVEKETPNDERLGELRSEGIWNIDEVEGGNNISLTRTFEKETIRITFSCQPGVPEESAENEFMNDEEAEAEGAAAEDEDAGEDDADLEPEPFDVTITIQKDGKPSIVADVLVAPSFVEVEGIRLLDARAKLDIDSLRNSTAYEGPQIDYLDPDVQVDFTNYLAERGISPELHGSIEDAKGWKEQREYVRWLNQLRKALQ